MKNINVLNATTTFSILALLVFLVFRILLLYSYESDIGGIENNVIYSICKVLNGGLLYDNPETGNFNITQYSPFYYYFPIFIGKILNLNPLNDLHSIYIISRFISLIFNLIGGLVIYKLLREVYKVKWQISIIAVSIYFLHLSRIHFASRPDSLFSLMSILVIYFLVKYLSEDNLKNNFRFLVLALSIASLTIFVKQTGIQFLFIIPSFFLLTKKIKYFFISSFLMLLITSFYFSIFYLLYGYNFVSNVFGGLDNGISLVRAYDVFSHFFLKYQFIFIFGVFFSSYFFLKNKETSLRFMSYNLTLLFFFALTTSIKEGSWINYYNEFLVAVIIITAIEINKYLLKADFSNSFTRGAIVILSIYIILLQPNIIIHKFFHEHSEHLKNTKANFEKKIKVATIINNKLADKSMFLAFDNHINSMLPIKAVVPNKDLVPSQSKFNYSKFDHGLKYGQVRYVIYPKKQEVMSFMGNDFSEFKKIYDDNEFIILENNFR
jgi:hypothetical protein